MDKDTEKTDLPTIVILGFIYLAFFSWFIYSSNRLWVKILFGIMGLFLFFGIMDRIRSRNQNNNKE